MSIITSVSTFIYFSKNSCVKEESDYFAIFYYIGLSWVFITIIAIFLILNFKKIIDDIEDIVFITLLLYVPITGTYFYKIYTLYKVC